MFTRDICRESSLDSFDNRGKNKLTRAMAVTRVLCLDTVSQYSHACNSCGLKRHQPSWGGRFKSDSSEACVISLPRLQTAQSQQRSGSLSLEAVF